MYQARFFRGQSETIHGQMQHELHVRGYDSAPARAARGQSDGGSFIDDGSQAESRGLRFVKRRRDGDDPHASEGGEGTREGTQRIPSLSHPRLTNRSEQRGLGGGRKIPSGALGMFSRDPNTPMYRSTLS